MQKKAYSPTMEKISADAMARRYLSESMSIRDRPLLHFFKPPFRTLYARALISPGDDDD